MTKAVILQVALYPDWLNAALDERFEVIRGEAARDPAVIAARASEIRAIAASGTTGADAALIGTLPRLEVIAVFGVGTDAVDLASARQRNIPVTNTPDVLTEEVADLAIGLWLAASRQIVAADAHVREGRWASGAAFPLSRRAHGKRAGILGFGAIGKAIGRRLQGFGMEIAYCARSDKQADGFAFIADPAALARFADVLFVIVPGGAATRGIVSRSVLEALGPDGLLVNVARGSTVDEEALIEALQHRRIRGAALDVFEREPTIDPRLLTLDNALLQPHHGSGTVETRRAMGELVLANLVAHFEGRPLLTPVE